MKNKTKIINILSFGALDKKVKEKIKSNENNINNDLKKSDLIPFDLNIFFNYIGTKDNIINSKSTLNSIILNLKDINLVDKDRLKKIGIKGILVNENSITLILGNYAGELKKQLQL